MAIAPDLFKSMVAGAAAENALKQYAMMRKAARGETLPQAARTNIKATSASEYADELYNEFGIDVEGMGIETEMPSWLLGASFDRLAETFEEDYWQEINEYTRYGIETDLRNGIENGKSIREIANEIAETAPERAGWRAVNTARTEIGNAQNAGHEMSIRELGQDSGVEFDKEWLSVCSATTREDHCALDGTQVPVNDTFNLGGEEARWPSDERLTAANRCNCMCTLISALAASEIEDDGEPDYRTELGQFGGEAGYDPNQPRDDHGRFGSGSGGSESKPESSGGDKPAADKDRDYGKPRESAVSDHAAAVLDQWTIPARGSREGEYAKIRQQGEAWVKGESNEGFQDLYDETQARLAADGVKELTAYRGVDLPNDHPLAKAISDGSIKSGSSISTKGMALASFSEKQGVAEHFADSPTARASRRESGSIGIVFRRVIPAIDVVGGERTHSGFLDGESEIIAKNQSSAVLEIVGVFQ